MEQLSKQDHEVPQNKNNDGESEANYVLYTTKMNPDQIVSSNNSSFTERLFSVELEESVTKSLRDYNTFTDLLTLTNKQKFLFPTNTFIGPALTFHSNSTSLSRYFATVSRIMAKKYDSADFQS